MTPPRTHSLQDAKNKFSAVVEAALNGTPQEVSRRGKPAVVVVAAEEYARLVAAAQGRRTDFVDHLLSFPQPNDDTDGNVEEDLFPRASFAFRDVDF